MLVAPVSLSLVIGVEHRSGHEVPVIRLISGLLSLVLFVGAAMLSRSASIPAPATPDAADVRAAKTIAGGVARAAAADGPAVVTLTRAHMVGASRVVSNGLPRLRLAPQVDGDRLRVDAAFGLTGATWLNASVSVTGTPQGGYPHISARLGAVPVPAPALDLGLRVIHRLVQWRAGAPIPAPRQALLDFEARGDHAVALIDLPRGLLRTLGKAVPNTDPIAGAAAGLLYARALDRLGGRRDVDLAEVYAVLFADAPAGVAARDHARAAMVAAAMATAGPYARRLATIDDAHVRRRVPATLRVRLAGREDLAKHFALSAALAAAADPEIGRALGTWKELDDSLAGGSGFSFVDLAADRAGLRLGQAAADPGRAGDLARAFGDGPVDLLPTAALGFEEGMSDRAFEARYGSIATVGYAAAVTRIDAALDTLPVMQR
jgi:hypothetical protein